MVLVEEGEGEEEELRVFLPPCFCFVDMTLVKKQKKAESKRLSLPQFTSANSCFRASQIGSDALSDWKRARRLGEGAGSREVVEVEVPFPTPAAVSAPPPTNPFPFLFCDPPLP